MVTESHYARCVGDAYREPFELEPGEVRTDFLARLPCMDGPSQLGDGARRRHAALAPGRCFRHNA